MISIKSFYKTKISITIFLVIGVIFSSTIYAKEQTKVDEKVLTEALGTVGDLTKDFSWVEKDTVRDRLWFWSNDPRSWPDGQWGMRNPGVHPLYASQYFGIPNTSMSNTIGLSPFDYDDQLKRFKRFEWTGLFAAHLLPNTYTDPDPNTDPVHNY